MAEKQEDKGEAYITEGDPHSPVHSYTAAMAIRKVLDIIFFYRLFFFHYGCFGLVVR